MKTFIKFAIWIPVILMAAVIFGFSTQSGLKSSGLSRRVAALVIDCSESMGIAAVDELQREQYIECLQVPIRKGAHMTEYAVLFTLVFIALTVDRVVIKLRYCMSFAMTFFFACTDEIHQLYVPGRSGSIADVFIDSCGCFIAMALIFIVLKHIRKNSLHKTD
ncbi:MAG: VanZ family protein [Eubacteriales bacterium]|nr:VanZ family protein [Eubacteriales bacterium]